MKRKRVSTPADGEITLRDVGFRVARQAHWLINDRAYTKRSAAIELADIARRLLPPDLYEQAIGDAGKL